MGTAKAKEASAEGERTEASAGPRRPDPRLVMKNRPGTHWLVARLPDRWAVWDEDQAAAAAAEPPEVLVRWGSLEGPDGTRLTLNRLENLRVAQDLLEVRETWRAARVRSLSGEAAAQVRRRFRVDVFNGQVLAVHLRDRGGRLRPLAFGASREGLLAAWAAMRALHALRLDFGAVWIGMQGLRTYALSVDPAPHLTPTLAATYSSALLELESSRLWWPGDPPVSHSDVVLGADPEFVLRDRMSGDMIPASEFFSRYGVVGCDRQFFDRTTRSLALVEVRPDPSPDPEALTEHIREALVMAAERMPNQDIEWVAGSRPFARFAIGGHVHFTGLPLTRALLVALDNYLALPVMMVERAATARLRRHRYGFLGDVRLKEHGGFEYRTLGSWLVSPNLTRAVLSLAKLVATDHPFLRQDWLAAPTLQEAFHACRKDAFYDLMTELWRDLERAPSYGRLESNLSLLRTMLVRRQRWNEQANLRETWRI